MEAFTWVGFVAFFVVATAVGFRLLLLWWRTRELPELLIASGVLGIGTFGFAFSVFAMLLMPGHPGLGRLMWAVALFAMGLGGTTTYLFTCVVFRRDASWARALVWTTGVLFALGFVAEAAISGFVFEGDPQRGVVMQATSWLRVGAFGWGAGESLVWWHRMRRRAALGLGDPVVQNRFLLWAVGIGAAGWGSVVGLLAGLLFGLSAYGNPWLQLSSSLHGLAAAVAMWLAFLPPAWYLRRVEAGAGARA